MINNELSPKPVDVSDMFAHIPGMFPEGTFAVIETSNELRGMYRSEKPIEFAQEPGQGTTWILEDGSLAGIIFDASVAIHNENTLEIRVRPETRHALRDHGTEQMKLAAAKQLVDAVQSTFYIYSPR